MTDIRISEIARKFYASLRHNSQCQNSSSLDSYNTDISLPSNTPSSNFDQPRKFSQEENIKFFPTPRFFQSIPNEGLKFISKKIFFFFRYFFSR